MKPHCRIRKEEKKIFLLKKKALERKKSLDTAASFKYVRHKLIFLHFLQSRSKDYAENRSRHNCTTASVNGRLGQIGTLTLTNAKLEKGSRDVSHKPFYSLILCLCISKLWCMISHKREECNGT